MEEFLQVALRGVEQAGKFLLSYFGKVSLKDAEEKKTNDFVSFVDRKSEEIIKDVILSHFKDHGFLGEEEGAKGKGSQFLWVVDPLDGTKNFLHGIDAFAISCALMKEGEVVLGIVHLPAKNLYYSAIKGKGAWRNKDRIYVAKNVDLERSLFATAFPFRDKSKFDSLNKIFSRLYFKFSDVRRIGSAAYDLCLTAEGVFSVFYEFGLSIWDIAAGSLIVEEAGGEVVDFDGGKNFLATGNIVAGTKEAVSLVLDAIREVGV